ncbi:hypothetical protein DYB31_015866, partial [Aphanomyces astaci]
MFQRFCHDRSADADNVPADVRFFDASINQKLNRSMTLGKKYDVSFLEDKAESIRETYVAPPPSTMGLPDNGMRYKYRGFPRLKRRVRSKAQQVAYAVARRAVTVLQVAIKGFVLSTRYQRLRRGVLRLQ